MRTTNPLRRALKSDPAFKMRKAPAACAERRRSLFAADHQPAGEPARRDYLEAHDCGDGSVLRQSDQAPRRTMLDIDDTEDRLTADSNSYQIGDSPIRLSARQADDVTTGPRAQTNPSAQPQ
jgi:hypothetical protein